MKERKSDILWKMVMDEVFEDLLRFVFPDADQVYNLDRGFEFLDKELAEMYPEPEKESDTRFADKLVKEKIPELELLERKIMVAKLLFRRGFPSRKVRAIFNFLENYVLFEGPGNESYL